ncbi:DoxX family protein [Kitasatospora sp. NPDC051853]|uniref:DoxX family protein n=1 Tax=Kitasatospora sp. NPDC051853 TaxID=3364058 RepID=UPI0037AE7AC7
MNVALWIVAGFLAVAYLAGGGLKLVLSKARIAAFGPASQWVGDFSAGGVKAIGALEVLAGLGLVLPAAVGVAPVLAPLAALGLVLLMAGAAVVRFRRGEMKLVAVDLGYLLLAAFVAWGRFGPEAFTV